MKTRETKQNDLNALTASLAASKSAMVVSFKGVSVAKDQEFRNSIREAGAKYEVVKNTLARIAVKGTDFEQASEYFKGVTAIAWTENDPVVLSKAISKFMKDNADAYSFKAGVVDGSLVDLTQLNVIANLPSKEELISKLLFVLNAQAQRLVTVINAVPRDLAVVIKQIGDKAPESRGGEATAAVKADTAEQTEAARAEETAPVTTEAQDEANANAADDAAKQAVDAAPLDEENVLEIPAAEAPAEENAE
jgi:large subunit ribosomal protein L10